jgi:hypothetical protein
VFSTLEGFGVFTVQYVGSSFTQLADQEAGFGCVGCAGSPRFIAFGDPTISSIRYDSELPSYEIGNLRLQRSLRLLGGGAVHQQHLGRASLSVARPRARHQRARGVPHEPAAHVRRDAQDEFLICETNLARAGHGTSENEGVSIRDFALASLTAKQK